MKVYLAGPEVFHPQSEKIFKLKEGICRRMGFVPTTPFDARAHMEDMQFSPDTLGKMIYLENIKLIELSDAVVANITPFRGPHMDCGTAFELGYAHALRKRVACYSQDERGLSDRIKHTGFLDKEGLIVENFDMAENLMIAAPALIGSCGVVVKHVSPKERFLSQLGFLEALLSLKDGTNVA